MVIWSSGPRLPSTPTVCSTVSPPRRSCQLAHQRGRVGDTEELAYAVFDHAAHRAVVRRNRRVRGNWSSARAAGSAQSQCRLDVPKTPTLGYGGTHKPQMCALWMMGKIYGVCPRTGRKRALRQPVWATSTVLSQVFTIAKREGICSQPRSGSIWRDRGKSAGRRSASVRRDLHPPCGPNDGSECVTGHSPTVSAWGTRLSLHVKESQHFLVVSATCEHCYEEA
jgi:hypothetical protein